MDLVETPIGNVEKASFFAPACIYLIDLSSYMTILSAIIIFSGLHSLVLNLPETVSGIIAMLMAFFIYALAYLSHQERFPSPGYWALGVRKFKYEKLENYSGKGTLYVKEKLKPGTVLKRITILFVLIGISANVFKNIAN